MSGQLFDGYLTEVEHLCLAKFGVGLGAFPDYNFRDAFDANVFPKDVVVTLATQQLQSDWRPPWA